MSDEIELPSFTPKKSHAKRSLFGKPDLAANDVFLTRLLNEIMMEKSNQWDFDFHNGVPLPSSSNFEYTAVPASNVPGFYSCNSLASSRQTSSSSLSSGSDSENYNPSGSMIDLDSSMESDDFKNSLKSPQKSISTPKKVRQPLFLRKKLSAKRSSKTMAASNDQKITSHMTLRVSKRIIKKTTATGATKKLNGFHQSASATNLNTVREA